MQFDPEIMLVLVFVAMAQGASTWRRNKLRRAMRDLPTPARRLIGPEPSFLPPPPDRSPPELASYTRLHRRSGYVTKGFWIFFGFWIAYSIFLVLRKQFL